MSKFKLVLTDIDGTVALPGMHTISERVRAAIIATENAGITVATVSGRPYEMAKDVLLALGIEGPCVFDNGATIRDSVTGEMLWSKWLAVEKVREIVQAILPFCTIIDYSGRYDEHAPVDNEPELVESPAPYVFALIPTDKVEHIEQLLSQIEGVAAHTAASLDGNAQLHGLQVTDIEADKYHGVEALRKLLGATKEESFAIGDANNDLPLFRNAGLKVAMGNATDRLKAQADYIVSSVQEDGFAEAIDRFVLN